MTALRLAWVFNPTPLYYLGRLVTVAFAVAALGVLYRLGRLFFKDRVVLLALLFFSFDPVFLRYSQRLQTDVSLLFYFLLASYFMIKMHRNGELKHYLYCGIAIGLGTATKYTPIILLFPAVLTHFLRIKRDDEPWFSAKLIWLIVLPPLVFCLLLPYSILDFATFSASIAFQFRHLKAGHFSNRPAWFFPGIAIQAWWMHVLVLLSVVYFIATEKKINVVLYLINPLLFYLFIIKNATIFEYYLLPVFPFFYLLLANFLVGLSQTSGKLFTPASRRAVAGSLLFIAAVSLLFPLLKADRKYHRIKEEKDISTQAREWIEKNIPTKTIIISEVWQPQVQTYTFASRLLRSPAFTDVIPQLISEFRKRPIYFLHVVKVNVMKPGASAIRYHLDNYRLFPYFIVNSSIAGRYQAKPQEFPVHNKFYADIAREFSVAAILSPFDQPSVAITVYRNPRPRPTSETPRASIIMQKMVQTEYRKKLNFINSFLLRNGFNKNHL